LAPRMLTMVVDAPSAPLGVPQGRRGVRSRKSSLDKPPWKYLPAHEGVVESIFVRPAYLGESVAPFRVLSTLEAVIPYDGTRIMDGADDRIDRYPGLAAWWRGAEQIWLRNRSSDRRTLIEQLDYMRQLSAQLPIAHWRVAYTASGNTLAAVVIQDHLGVVEHSLYWAPAATREEAQYLAAILNAPAQHPRPAISGCWPVRPAPLRQVRVAVPDPALQCGQPTPPPSGRADNRRRVGSRARRATESPVFPGRPTTHPPGAGRSGHRFGAR